MVCRKPDRDLRRSWSEVIAPVGVLRLAAGRERPCNVSGDAHEEVR